IGLQKTLTGAADGYGDISTWNPALCESLPETPPNNTLAPAASSSSKRDGKRMALDLQKDGEAGWRKYVKYFTPSYVVLSPGGFEKTPLTFNCARWFTVTLGT